VSPPSWLTATCKGAGAALPFSWPTNAAQHTYVVPKNGLDDALSAQICSLSENVVDDCREISTGGFQALFTPAAAAARSSVRETAMPSKPRNVCSERVAPRLAVRLA
jgi:hypothetical protein